MPAAAFLVGLVLLATACTEPAEPPPSTDIYLAQVTRSGSHLIVEDPVNLTDRDGYDNQPAFLPDGSGLLYTSIGDDGQADILRYDFGPRRSTRLMRTAEDEYSPTPRPGSSGFSVVRVEIDGKQRLWAFDASGADPVRLLEQPEPVGYHAWSDERTVALFVLGQQGGPDTLQIADLAGGEARIVATAVGRSLHAIPGRRSISFVDKQSDDAWWIRELDLDAGHVRALVRTLPDCEDYAWTPDGALLMMPCGSRLYVWRPEADEGWRQIADFADAGLAGLTRIAVSPGYDRLALVGERPPGRR